MITEFLLWVALACMTGAFGIAWTLVMYKDSRIRYLEAKLRKWGIK